MILTDSKTPYLLIDLNKIEQNFKRFRKNFPKAEIFYSVKANYDSGVLKLIKKLGGGFDVASWGEICILKEIGVKPSKILFSAPTKVPLHIANAYKYGIRMFAADSQIEVQKLATLAPNSKTYIRIAVDNIGSEWPLVKKFGVDNGECERLFLLAKKLKLNPSGLTFHVGSQNLNPKTWSIAITKIANTISQLQARGFEIDFLNIGGGFPAKYLKSIPGLREYSSQINHSLEKYISTDIKLIIEPGRSMVANAGKIYATVINRASRGSENWLYLDIGAYNGMIEVREGFKYNIHPYSKKRHKRNISFTVCGPTCDSTDKIMDEVILPDTIGLGDVLVIEEAGAYTTSIEKYNGFEYPKTLYKN